MKTSCTAVVVNVIVYSEPVLAPQLPVCVEVVVAGENRPPVPLTAIAPVHPKQPVQPSSTIVSQSSSTPLHASVAVHAPNAHDALHVCVPIVPHEVVQFCIAPGLHAKPSSTRESQSSSPMPHASGGSMHAPHAHPALQRREPVDPQLVVQGPVRPAQHAKPSSHAVLQSSSTPLQISGGGAHTLNAHDEPQVRDPIVPQLVMQPPDVPAQHAKPSSHAMSQSSSIPLHDSTGGLHMPHVHVAEHVLEPAVPHPLMQPPTAPRTHVNVSSTRASQSSSRPLQVSAGGVHAPYMQLALQVRIPIEPQLVVHGCVVEGTHSEDSSTFVSQSSSRPLQPSAGGVHVAPIVQVAGSQSSVPVEAQLVVQGIVVPPTHPKPSSAIPLQSSSRPLQTSAGGMHAVQVQVSSHERMPVDPHEVVQASVAPRTHAKTSSALPLQSSSTALHASGGGVHTDHAHDAVQVREPIVPHEVVHGPIIRLQHIEPSSQLESQLLSKPSQTSGAPGSTSGFVSLQSSATTPSLEGHAMSPCPSPSRSRVGWWQTPRGSSQVSVVQASMSSQSMGAPKEHVVPMQTSTPLHARRSSQSASVAHVMSVQPSIGSHGDDAMHTVLSAVCVQAPSMQRSIVQLTMSSHCPSAWQPPSGGPASNPESKPASTAIAHTPATQSTPGAHILPRQSSSSSMSIVRSMPRMNSVSTTRRTTKAPRRFAVTVMRTIPDSVGPGRSETV
jgi:hypothetical protein